MVRQRKDLLKIIILGDSNVGKTSLMNRYHSGKYTGQYKATIGADFLSKEITHPEDPSRQVSLQIWDTAGQERFQSLGVAFYRGADACLLVYDVTDATSFEKLSNWKTEFLKHVDNSQGDFPFVVMGNKADKLTQTVSRGTPLERVMDWCSVNMNADLGMQNFGQQSYNPSSVGSMNMSLQSHQQSRRAPIPHFDTSAATNQGVEEAFETVTKLALERNRLLMRHMFIAPPPRMVNLQDSSQNYGGQGGGEQCC